MKNNVKPVLVGDVWESNSSGKFEIINNDNMKKVRFRFLVSGYESIAEASKIRKGQVRDKLKPSICGVGFLGFGEYKSSHRSNHESAHTAWVNMIRRCYDPYVINKGVSYSDCFVCKEWHNYQNFAEWYHTNYPKDGGDYHIDKDIKNPGNKEYSPESCIFASIQVNGFVLDSGSSRGKFLIGASWLDRIGKFQANCNNPFTRKMDYLGVFVSEIDAHIAWREKKYEHAINLAKQQGRNEVKHALLNWAQALKEFRVHPIES